MPELKSKNCLLLSKLTLVCNYFYSPTMTAVVNVKGIIVFLKKGLLFFKTFSKVEKKVYRL